MNAGLVIPMSDDSCECDADDRETVQNDAADAVVSPESETVEVQYTLQRGDRWRLQFEQRGEAGGWWRREYTWTGCRWRLVGHEVVTDLEVSGVRES